MKQGFSLVELSIVLVILGLLTGGILAGQNLIRAAEIRSVNAQLQGYVSAAHTFRDKYFAIPGDFRDATRFWGRQVSAAHCATNSAAAGVAGTGVCDGNGDGLNSVFGAAAANSGETFQFWRQLAAAGLVEGNYTGLSGADNDEAVPGDNVPRAKLNNAAFNTLNYGNYPGDTQNYAFEFGNAFTIGGFVANNWSYLPVLKPEEAWNVDTKMDDGKPGTGKVIAGNRTTCANSTSATDYASDYRLDNTNTACVLYFSRQY